MRGSICSGTEQLPLHKFPCRFIFLLKDVVLYLVRKFPCPQTFKYNFRIHKEIVTEMREVLKATGEKGSFLLTFN